MDLTITIASWNTRQKTLECLASIERNAGNVRYAVIVVDNDSADGSAAAIAAQFPWVRLIHNAENRGFACAHNAAIQQSKGRYILVLNSDTVILDNALEKMVAFFDLAPADVGAIGCQILFSDLSLAPSARRFETYFGAFATAFQLRRILPPDRWLRERFGCVLRYAHDNYDPHDRVREVDFVDGAALMLRREALMRVGLLDEQYFFDFEDLDLGLRLKHAGYKVLYFPGAWIVHHMHQSRKQNANVALVHSFRSRLIFHSRMRATLVPMRLIVIAGIGTRAVAAFVTAALRSDSRRALSQTLSLYWEILRLAIRFRQEQTPALIPRLTDPHGE